MSAIVGPIAPYSNVPIQPEDYQPRRFVIEDIVLGQTTLVTTTTDMDYMIGQLVRLLIPQANGSYQLNEQQGFVISIPSDDQVVVSIDSSHNVNQFVSTITGTQPQIIAVGDINSGVQNTTGRTNNITYIPGSFINVSP